MANLDRVNAELQKQISEIIMYELKDPRISGILTVIEVRTAKDLNHAKVYVSYYGDEDRRKNVFAALNSSANFIRQTLKSRVKMRNIPGLTIVEDRSAEYAAHMSRVIDEATKGIGDE